MKFLPDFVGILTIALFTYVGYWLVPDAQVKAPMWIFIFLMFVAIGLYTWRDDKSPSKPSGWLYRAIGSIVVGGVFFLADMMGGHFAHPEMPLILAATHVGGLFGFVFTVIVFPCATAIYLAGALRASIVGERHGNA